MLTSADSSPPVRTVSQVAKRVLSSPSFSQSSRGATRFYSPPRASAKQETPHKRAPNASPIRNSDSTASFVHSFSFESLNDVKAKLVRIEELWQEALYEDSGYTPVVLDGKEGSEAGMAAPLSMLGNGPSGWAERERSFQCLKEIIEAMISDEMRRREEVILQIERLSSEIRSYCDTTGESLDQYIGDSHAPITSIYLQRGELAQKHNSLRQLISQRQEEHKMIWNQCVALREELEDFEEDEDNMPSSELTLSSLEKARRILKELETEKVLRIDALSRSAAQLLCLSCELSQSVPEPFRSPLDNLCDGVSIAILSPEHIRSALVSKGIRPPLSLSRKFICELKDASERVRVEHELLMKKVDNLIREIELFWDQLDIPKSHRKALRRSIECIDEYTAISDDLRVKWKQNMEEKVDSLLKRAETLWQQCHVPHDERRRFMDNIKDNPYSPLTVEILCQEIEILEKRYEVHRSLFKMVEDRVAFIQKMIDFEKTASDPKRLFRPSFRLVEEEKFRKTCYPTLLKMEDALRKGVQAMEAETGQPFICNGTRFLDSMSREISERFVNASVFVLDHGSTSSGITGTGGEIAGSNTRLVSSPRFRRTSQSNPHLVSSGSSKTMSSVSRSRPHTPPSSLRKSSSGNDLAASASKHESRASSPTPSRNGGAVGTSGRSWGKRDRVSGQVEESTQRPPLATAPKNATAKVSPGVVPNGEARHTQK
ncbi:uncharacterized protein SPPG_01480 [Spizellomyces punctatus DAOM BR117]|uniref:Uncharacterized protein n=1 Tax=Spizellomyces punctatus (strain DAOM BR117) TaxID=645134 RepID=A0A0L0HT32_SPIPD|nr:uncharacterized protein SPPG_01480 [Spizellomyces punctatus DAOM BR117]KND04034.1 hypothetical protein SPPG_01480 [Spizellomyces punctatus DAOM BR117]|eukprot:XP_016612073.1 hypothetical protein SPPG_01480 [Spizellomyces punctatus DAOM BR117]